MVKEGGKLTLSLDDAARRTDPHVQNLAERVNDLSCGFHGPFLYFFYGPFFLVLNILLLLFRSLYKQHFK